MFRAVVYQKIFIPWQRVVGIPDVHDFYPDKGREKKQYSLNKKKVEMYAFLRKKIAHVLKILFKGMQTSDVLHPEDEHLHLLSPSPSYRQSDSQRCRATER